MRARAVVNAAGPWVSRFVTEATPVRAAHQVRLVKGSHIVVRRLFAHRFAYIFQNEDRRIVFAIPYEHDFTLIGTTDVDYHDDPARVHIDAAEIDYLCALANRYFRQQLGAADVVWSYSGVRPLLEDEASDPMSVTRDYALELDPDAAPLLSVFGGKITTYRRLAEEAVDLLAAHLGRHAAPWTAAAKLPGGDLPEGSFAVFLRTLERRYPWLPARLRLRYAHAYGTRSRAGARRRGGTRRSGPRDPAAALRTRARVSVPRGMCAQRRGHPVAALEARPASARGRSRPAPALARGLRRKSRGYDSRAVTSVAFSAISRAQGRPAR